MNEWNIPMDQTIVIFIILFVMTWKIWNLTNASEMIDKKENDQNTITEANPDYGAYVWLAGKRFN